MQPTQIANLEDTPENLQKIMETMEKESVELDKKLADMNMLPAADNETDSNSKPAQAETTEEKPPPQPQDKPEVKPEEKAPDKSPAEKEKPAGEPNKEKTRYEKAVERQKSAWENIKLEKEALKKRERELDERERLIEARSKAASREYTPEQYEAFAEKAEEEGKFDLAEAARAKAKELREKAPAEQQAIRISAAQDQSWAVVKRELPSAFVKDSEDNKGMVKLVVEHGDLFESYGRAPELIMRLWKAQSAAAAAESASKNLEEIKAERDKLLNRVKELESAIQPGSSIPAPVAGSRSFEDLSPAEQEAWIKERLFSS